MSKSGQRGKNMMPPQKSGRLARLYDQHDHSPQRSEFTQVAYPLLRTFSVEQDGVRCAQLCHACGQIGLRSKLRCVYIDRAESREDVADGA